jgi:hypothetical protein
MLLPIRWQSNAAGQSQGSQGLREANLAELLSLAFGYPLLSVCSKAILLIESPRDGIVGHRPQDDAGESLLLESLDRVL